MRRLKNMYQMKEQDKIKARQLNKMEINNMLDREFKVIVIKILTGLEKRVKGIGESLK